MLQIPSASGPLLRARTCSGPPRIIGISAASSERRRTQRTCQRLQSYAAAIVEVLSTNNHSDVRQRKEQLLELIEPTGRGYRASKFLRGMIEEAQVAVEALGGAELKYELLPGKWRLQYTTAADVLPILEAESRLAPPFGPSLIQVGGIFQRFSGVEEGLIENIIQLSTPFLLRERDGITVTVKARYEVRSPHRISLIFEEAVIGDVHISEGLEAALAPAMLPRTSLQHAALLFLKEFKLRFPFNSARQLATRIVGDDSPGAGGGNYQLTFLDEDMLIGRASALGGSFIFTREPHDE